jgi:hypothetical protein
MKYCVTLLFLIGFPIAVHAETPQSDAARKWGLIGVWAISCEAPASRENPFYIYESSDGRLFVRRDSGDFKDVNEVVSAKIIDENEFEITIDFRKFSRTMTAVYGKISNDKFRSRSNVDGSGHYTIKDGKLTHNGELSPVMNRCVRPVS